MASDQQDTPLMQQYWRLKSQAGDALLLFRMGDFYELFGDDAVEASRILEITLTSRDKGRANPTPMAGVPHHSAQNYIQRLLKVGKKVAIGEQMEDPAEAAARGGSKAIVRREIIRTFTPAVQFDLEGSETAFLATAVKGVLACLDCSTGEVRISEPLTADRMSAELAALPIRHFVSVENLGLPSTATESALGPSVLSETLPSNYLSFDQASDLLRRHYRIENLAAFLPPESQGSNEAAIHALGILVTYALRSQQQQELAHLKLPLPLRQARCMILGPRTPQHLDLLPTAEGQPNLFTLINKTRSVLGARQLRRWMLEPLRSSSEIHARQAAVSAVGSDSATCGRVSAELSTIYDLERICGRVNTLLAQPRDTLALGQSLLVLPKLVDHLHPLTGASSMLSEIRQGLIQAHEHLGSLGERIVRTQHEEAPTTSRDGMIFKKGTSPELDRLISLTEDGQNWLVDLEARERDATGIPSLKVRYNRVFGYYIEITQAHLKNAPAHYQRKQTTVGAERFFTEELKRFEDEFVTAGTKQRALEQSLFAELVAEIRERTAAIMSAARWLGELDATLSLALLGREPGWCFPKIDDTQDLEIEAGRHPLVDEATRGAFVPNDLNLSPSTRQALVITGPNMGGKSTVMRQVALIAILGQMGAPVPAISARWGAFSSIYTRIGAHDAIARGQSTFMVEMSELAHILHHADQRSLIILDEIGRGTSTYDGMSVAWATLEWICNQIQARTLFATHYHELTRLAGDRLPGLGNAHMAVEGGRAGSSSSENLRFLYQLKEGPTNESFGIHVARIAGLPAPVISRAWSVLEKLENSGSPLDAPQMSFAFPDSKARISTCSVDSALG